jgi:PKHD-type hydroxylase
MLTIADVLNAEDLARVRERLAELPFKDGRLTAGPTARRVKKNNQADGNDIRTQALARFVRKALDQSPLIRAYARPARWSRLMFSRYEPGDAYGLHVDDPHMVAEEGGRMRTDLSFTLFLSDPSTYEGGALLVDGIDGEREARPPAGSLVVYETGDLHRVTPVTSGERLACVGWMQSMIRGREQREVLFDLARARVGMPEGPGRLLLDKSINALLRMWGEA